MKNNEHIVNLDLPPYERWSFLSNCRNDVNDLLQCYLNDFDDEEFIFEGISSLKQEVISEDYLEEIDYIASISMFTPDQVLTANLYYDILKFYFGCTAFAVHSKGKILHSRNLDWWTDNNLLSEHSAIFNFRKNGKTIFKTVGWPGFIGALSGTRPGCFSITLNAVLSKDSPELATPVSFLLRDILCSCDSFHEAKEKLENTTIASDCLLLISGTKADQLSVIERTPTRFATRDAVNRFIVVANDYKLLENSSESESVLQATSCGRFERVSELLQHQLPCNVKECFKILQDKNVMMKLTVQQMVFDNATGDIELIKTETQPS